MDIPEPPRRVKALKIRRYRSINDEVVLDLPEDIPLVLLGENNAGKSNLIRALELVLGEWWPGTHNPEDHEFWNRADDEGAIEIEVGLKGVYGRDGDEVQSLRWTCQGPSVEPQFKAVYAWGEGYANNQIRHQCTAILVGADRRLSYQLSYASKGTLLSKLMTMFHKHLVSDPTRVVRLKESFEQIQTIFREVTEFSRFQEALQLSFNSMLAGMSYGLGIDFSAYDPSNYFHSLRVYPSEADETRTFEELGTGQEQILAFAFAEAYAKAFYGGLILIVEEPEAHLHPLAQQWLARNIRSMAHGGLQVILTTHSPAFVDILGLRGIALVRKTPSSSTRAIQLSPASLAQFCLEHGARPERCNETSILPFYAASSTEAVLSGLFAKKVALVEGQTEQFALPRYLMKAGLDVERHGIAIIPVMGKGNLAKWWRFFTAFGIPVYFIFDNDSSEDPGAQKRGAALEAIGLDSPTIETITTTDDILISDSFAVFGLDFEQAMRGLFKAYGSVEEEATDRLGESKPIIARYVADHLQVDTGDMGWVRLRELAEKLIALGPGGSLPEHPA